MDEWNQAFSRSQSAAENLLRQSTGITQDDLEKAIAPTVEAQFPELGALLPYRVTSIAEAAIAREGRILNYEEHLLGGDEPLYTSGV